MAAHKTIMPIPPRIAEFWSRYVAATGAVDESRFYEAFHFGDHQELANSLAELVMAGRKRATAGSVWSFEAEGKRLPRPGDLSVVTDYSGNPLCMIETTRVDVVPFREVSAEFAAVEGEGDGSLDYWRLGHAAYFTRECARHGRMFDANMLVACERFDVVFRGCMRHPIYRVTSFSRLGGHTLRVSFDDGTAQTIDFSPVLDCELFGPLRDPAIFDQVRLDPEAHTLVWPTGADFDPATLHDWPEQIDALTDLTRSWQPGGG